MKRVVITGIGIVSCIGNNKEEVVESLRGTKSGISYSQEFAEMGFIVWHDLIVSRYLDDT